MNNEDRTTVIGEIESLAADDGRLNRSERHALTLALEALRTPSATGAAMREAAEQIDRWTEERDDGFYTKIPTDDLRLLSAAIRALPAPEVPECHGCKHWTISPYARDFEKQNQYGYCRGMRAYGVEIETTGDCSVDAIGTDATFYCKGWEAR